MSINYQKLEQRFEKIGRLENIINILNWDMACNIKKGSQESRTLEIIDLTQIIKKLLTSQRNQKFAFTNTTRTRNSQFLATS
ncbi:Zn-dependent carboxypeptidase [Onion yellows phytoplasma OY-M]|uniref:Zn-dependent carboxypeptidase n=1 Tax=Onion yellows phytoplasma (strain OY-M) TaxID=262768 RepID=Q6YR30_ONYPE|nr:Zn-dependent carboxypeptidase [Onion yellows phytoplasma OY-M]